MKYSREFLPTQRQGVQVSTNELPHLLQGHPVHVGQIRQSLIENSINYQGS